MNICTGSLLIILGIMVRNTYMRCKKFDEIEKRIDTVINDI